ncbi:hypothetical protein LCGC14_1628970 [marine sediment metagenome]|uniref:Uncharacterized protein n=1 Tax=marine sediment metagenome TaxID=412755 RepID=A0A0F9I3K7_9ZZZZ
MDYFELKKLKAKEQGKTWWFEAVLTDEEANLRTTEEKYSTCNRCRSLRDTARHKIDTCLLKHHPTDILTQVCDEWRYFA